MTGRGYAAIIAAAMCLNPGAYAQTGAGEANKKDEDPLVLPTVNIKGDKIKRTQQETYTSVGVVTGQQIEDLGLKDVRDALRLQGNVYVSPSNNGNNGISIRGINSEGIGEPGANVRSLTTLVIDGAAQSFEGMRRGQRGSWDVEQIEVLRGPQSTLQGRNSLAGAVLVKTHDPTDYWEGAARVTFEQRDLFSPAFMLSGPISDDFSFRVAGETARGNKGITYANPEIASLDDDEYRNFRGKLRFKPTALPQLDIKLTLSSTMDDPAVAAVTGPDYFARRFVPVALTAVEQRRNEVKNQILEASYELKPGLTITSITSNVETDARLSSPVPAFNRRELRADRDVSQEIRLTASPDRTFSGVVGVFAGRFRNNRDSLIQVQLAPSLPAVAIQDVRSQNTIENAAVFGEGRLEFAPGWKVLFGARYDSESFHQTFTDRLAGTSQETDTNYHAFLPKWGLIHELSETRSVAFTRSQGYRAGFKELGRTIKPEYLTSYEVAYRSVEAAGRIIFNANVFYYDWRNQQLSIFDPSNPLITITDNAGRSHSYGSELSLAWRPNRRLDIGGSVGLLRTQLDEYDSSTGNFAGKEFPEAPRATGALWAIVRFDRGLFAAFDVSARGRAYATSDLANQASFAVPGRAIAGLRLGYETARFSAVVFVDNLFDQNYLAGRDIRGGAYVGDMRTAGVTLTARF